MRLKPVPLTVRVKLRADGCVHVMNSHVEPLEDRLRLTGADGITGERETRRAA